VFGEDLAETAEVTWHGTKKGNEVRVGLILRSTQMCLQMYVCRLMQL
jgi:hypothetical protein